MTRAYIDLTNSRLLLAEQPEQVVRQLFGASITDAETPEQWMHEMSPNLGLTDATVPDFIAAMIAHGSLRDCGTLSPAMAKAIGLLPMEESEWANLVPAPTRTALERRGLARVVRWAVTSIGHESA